MPFEIQYSQLAVKQLQKLDKAAQKNVLKRIEKISQNPELSKPLGNVFKNFRSERIGGLRIVFKIQPGIILIAKIAPRKEAYDP